MKKPTRLLSLLFLASCTSFVGAQQGGPFGGGPFGGGPGMGGPGMGGPGMGGPGGPGGWGGGGGRGGRGGEGGGRGGDAGPGMGMGGGGFDPTQFLSRMDTNGNGSIDPEEAQGPARFMLDRMARDNPKIDLTKPIPLATLTEAFQKMRGGGPGGDGRGGPGDDELLEPENNSLVPGFSVKRDKTPVPGFGASGEHMVRIEERDLKEADDRIKRYDKNNDQALDENEMKDGRWTDSPMQYDRNRDGKLSRQELATRQARRRTLKSEQEPKKKEVANSNKTRENADEKKEVKNPYEKIASYRTTTSDGKAIRPAGLPEWFTKNDINFDNQVSMKEFTKKWSAEAVEDFQRFDTNHDGFITVKESLVAVKKVLIPGTMSSSAVAANTSPEKSGSSGSSETPTNSDKPKESAGASPANSKIDDGMRKFAASRIKKNDKDGNGFLTTDEFKEGDFAKADLNKDGKIDVEEYATFRNNR